MSLVDLMPKILIVDDQAANLHIMNQVLSDQYHLFFAKDGPRAIEIAKERLPELILLDIMMPDMDGYEVCQKLKADPNTSHIPVIFVTSKTDVEDEEKGFDVGAVDYIAKPFSPPIVRARVKTHLSLVSIASLQETRMQIIQRLGRAAEYKDNETGMHVIRMSQYAKLLAKVAGMDNIVQDLILHAAPMHDIGKIGTPDNILLKPGKLNDEEWLVMQAHAQTGADIIGSHDAPLLDMARSIALTHHEKWNGEGYPNCLSEQKIPIEGRIVAIADVFDALTTKRPYKEAWKVSDAIDYMHENAGSHFDPNLMRLFRGIMPDILDIKEKWSEHDPKYDIKIH